MRGLTRGQHVTCSLTGEHSYDRMVGTCHVGDTDLTAAIIRQGVCARCPRYDPWGRYSPAQREAGPWRGSMPGYCSRRGSAIAPYAPLGLRRHRPRTPGNLEAGYTGGVRVDGFGFMSWDREALAAAGLPAIDYPIPNGAFEAVVLGGGHVPNPQLLAWLQGYAETDIEAWRTHWPAMTRIAELLMVPEDAPRGLIEAANWRLLLEPVDLAGDIVTVSRGEELVAALASGEHEIVKAAHYRPLDERAAEMLIGAGHRPAPDGTVCLRPNGFEYMKDQTASFGQMYAYEGGRCYLSYWPNGLGIDHRGEELPDWLVQRGLTPLPWRQLGAELVAQALYGEAQSTWEDEMVNVRPLSAPPTSDQC
jgi:hypothetical protein